LNTTVLSASTGRVRKKTARLRTSGRGDKRRDINGTGICSRIPGKLQATRKELNHISERRQRHSTYLTWPLRERKERGVHANGPKLSPRFFAGLETATSLQLPPIPLPPRRIPLRSRNSSRARQAQTVKRPEGRAPF